MYGDPPSIVRLNPFAPVGAARRPHPKAAHPPLVVAQVRHLVETTTFPYQVIAVRTGVNSGTIARRLSPSGIVMRTTSLAGPATRRSTTSP